MSQIQEDWLEWAVLLAKHGKIRVLARQVARNRSFEVRIMVSEDGARGFSF